MTEQENEEFKKWLSRVEQHLEAMVKKSISELNVKYNFHNDFYNGAEAHETATRLIKMAYSNGVRR